MNTEGIGDKARSLLMKVQEGEEETSSSALTFDELVWAVRRHRALEDAIVAGEAFLSFRSLKLVFVDRDLLAFASGLIRRYSLDPRESIHAASAILNKAQVIVSTDEHFDKIRELRRETL